MKALPSTSTSSGASVDVIQFSKSQMLKLIRQEVHSVEQRDAALVKSIQQLDCEVDYSHTIQKLEARIKKVTKRAEVALAFMTKNSGFSGDNSRSGSEAEAMVTTSDSMEHMDRKSGQLFQIMKNTTKALTKMHALHEALTAATPDSQEESEPAVLTPSNSTEHSFHQTEPGDPSEHEITSNVFTQTKNESKLKEEESSRPTVSSQPLPSQKLPYPPLPLTTFPESLNMAAALHTYPQKLEVHLALIRNPPNLSVLWNVQERDPSAPPMESYSVYMTMEKVKGCGVFSDWTSLGEVAAIPLPMCVMISKYKPGYKVCVSVVGKDKFGRYGPYSDVVTAAIPE